jgi:regulator of chromosome condensation
MFHPSRTPSRATSQGTEPGTPSQRLDPPRQSRNPLPKINQRPTTRLAVYIAGGTDNRELGLGDDVQYDYGDEDEDAPPHGLAKPCYNQLLDPVTVGVVQVAVGLKHTVALTHDGRVLTWGRNDFGCLGRPARSAREEGTPGYVTSLEMSKVDVVQVVATEYATFVLTAEGHVCGWGTFMVTLPSFTCSLFLFQTKCPHRSLQMMGGRRGETVKFQVHREHG